jgi:uncharacterized membrane protein
MVFTYVFHFHVSLVYFVIEFFFLALTFSICYSIERICIVLRVSFE